MKCFDSTRQLRLAAELSGKQELKPLKHRGTKQRRQQVEDVVDFRLLFSLRFYFFPLRFKVLLFLARESVFGIAVALAARSNNTATCAIAALSVPMPSGVFAFVPTRSGF